MIAAFFGALLILAGGSSSSRVYIEWSMVLFGIVMVPICLGLYAVTMYLAVWMAEWLGDVMLFPLTLMVSIIVVGAFIGIISAVCRQRTIAV